MKRRAHAEDYRIGRHRGRIFLFDSECVGEGRGGGLIFLRCVLVRGERGAKKNSGDVCTIAAKKILKTGVPLPELLPHQHETIAHPR